MVPSGAGGEGDLTTFLAFQFVFGLKFREKYKLKHFSLQACSFVVYSTLQTFNISDKIKIKLAEVG
jgi:hypothetical protein